MNNDVPLIRTDGQVLVLSISNPATRKSIGPKFFQAASNAVKAAARDPEVGAVVFTGSGGIFCSGGNLHQLASSRDHDAATRLTNIGLLHRLILDIRASPKPAIMAVEGGAAGAGSR